MSAALSITVALIMSYPNGAQAQEAPVGLGTAADFSVLAGQTVTNTGDTTMEQSLGVSPGSTATGFPPGEVGGETHLADAVAEQAK
jgi:type VI secretion system secreted protein VgrG